MVSCASARSRSSASTSASDHIKVSALLVAMRQRPEQFGPRRRRRARLREELAPQFLLDAAPPLDVRPAARHLVFQDFQLVVLPT